MRNFKIAAKLTIGFGVLLVALVIAIFFAMLGLRTIEGNLDTFFNKPFQNVAMAIQIDRESEAAAKYLLQACLETGNEEKEEMLSKSKESLDTIQETLAALKANASNPSVVEAVEEPVQKLDDAFDKLESVVKSSDSAASYQVYKTDVVSTLEEISQSISEVRDLAVSIATDSHTTGMETGNTAIIRMVVIGVVAIVVGVILALYITRSITSAIKQVELAARKLSEGNFDTEIKYQSKDELGHLATSLRNSMGILKAVVGDLNYLMGEMADGNFTVQTNEEDNYVGELQPILIAMRKLKGDMNRTLSSIVTAADQVNTGANQVSAGAQMLAQSTTEQASAVDELVATINEVSQHITLTAESAETAKTKNMDSNQELQNCSDRMKELVQAMGVIEEKSNEVSKVIKAIDDIAFQTNILALNAAVEAARAGTAGKGFAVVAEEVRNLAGKSAEAAKSTTDLIEEAIRAVGEGAKLTQTTEEALNRVVVDSRSILDAVVQISDASVEQSESVKQISTGIEQISDTVQTNSATSEQSAAASQQMSGQAQMLENMVAVFTLDKNSDGDSISISNNNSSSNNNSFEETINFDDLDY